MKAKTIQSFLDNCEMMGEDREIYGLAPLIDGGSNCLSFCDFPNVNGPSRRPLDYIDVSGENLSKKESRKVLQKIENSESSVILCPSSVYYKNFDSKTLLLVDNPRLSFINIINEFFSSDDQVGLNCFSSIVSDEFSVISKSCYIGPHVYVSPGCKIGENVILYGNIYIYPGVTIGNNVIIHAGTIIGAEGFGFWRSKKGDLIKFPQIGSVIIEDNVEIQANVCIDRGTLGNTIIGEGTKIDNFVHIAHNVQIGKNCAIVAHSMIGGSVKIEDNCWIAPCASILNQMKIGENSVIGMGSVVLKEVGSNQTVKGVPAK